MNQLPIALSCINTWYIMNQLLRRSYRPILHTCMVHDASIACAIPTFAVMLSAASRMARTSAQVALSLQSGIVVCNISEFYIQNLSVCHWERTRSECKGNQANMMNVAIMKATTIRLPMRTYSALLSRNTRTKRQTGKSDKYNNKQNLKFNKKTERKRLLCRRLWQAAVYHPIKPNQAGKLPLKLANFPKQDKMKTKTATRRKGLHTFLVSSQALQRYLRSPKRSLLVPHSTVVQLYSWRHFDSSKKTTVWNFLNKKIWNYF